MIPVISIPQGKFCFLFGHDPLEGLWSNSPSARASQGYSSFPWGKSLSFADFEKMASSLLLEGREPEPGKEGTDECNAV